MCILLLWLILLQTVTDHADKPCTVTEVREAGSKSDCHGWVPAKGEKMIMPPEVNRQLRVGDVYYFVWRGTRWVAELGEPLAHVTMNTVAIITDPDQPAVIVPYDEAREQYDKYAALTLTHEEDLKLFAALTSALGILPKPMLTYTGDEPSVAARKLAEWKARQ